MSRRTKILAAVAVIIVAALLVAAYVTKQKEPEDAAMQDDPITWEAVSGGPLLDEPPDESWADDSKTGYNGFTTRAQLGSDAESIGVLTIEKIGVSIKVYDSDDNTVMEDMKRGAAHYRTTSYFDGNIGFAAHIGNASYSYFERLRELEQGDIIIYETTLGLRQYAVETIREIAEDDWSMLERTDDNRVTLTTCIEGQPTMRLCVQAVEV